MFGAHSYRTVKFIQLSFPSTAVAFVAFRGQPIGRWPWRWGCFNATECTWQEPFCSQSNLKDLTALIPSQRAGKSNTCDFTGLVRRSWAFVGVLVVYNRCVELCYFKPLVDFRTLSESFCTLLSLLAISFWVYSSEQAPLPAFPRDARQHAGHSFLIERRWWPRSLWVYRAFADDARKHYELNYAICPEFEIGCVGNMHISHQCYRCVRVRVKSDTSRER